MYTHKHTHRHVFVLKKCDDLDILEYLLCLSVHIYIYIYHKWCTPVSKDTGVFKALVIYTFMFYWIKVSQIRFKFVFCL